MGHSRISFGIWMVISVAYLIFTGWAIYYAMTCTEFLCAMVMVFPALPWYLVLNGIMDEMSETGFAFVSVVLALINIAILYLFLGLINGLIRRVRKRNVES